MNVETQLVLLNFIFWILPVFYFKGLSRIVFLATSLIFSGSYWALSALKIFFDGQYQTSVVQDYVNSSLLYSCFAAFFFYFSAILVSPRRTILNNSEFSRLIDLNVILPRFNFYSVLKFASLAIAFYSFWEAQKIIGVAGRRYFIDEIAPFWHVTLMPINGIILMVCAVYDFKEERRGGRGWGAWFTFILCLFHVVLVGFDGSRRDAFLPIVGYAISFLFLYQKKIDMGSRIKEKKPLFFAICLVLISSFLSLNRGFLVGWTFISSFDFDLLNAIEKTASYVFAAMPTLHVNTNMLAYIDLNGVQGADSYVYGLMNTLFPHFIFGEYIFGQPLVLRIQDELGWVGFDFGFMAEAIYAGGLPAVCLVHFSLGLVMGGILRGLKRGKLICLALLIGIIFGMVNSLRSDFMNFMKSFLYSAFLLYIVFNVATVRYKKVMCSKKGINRDEKASPV
ncbi:hypothetical protein [Alloalcanivorax marinus]|uniref:hypothetical protein n=1 Tax=Alloalcanivorax marinus TaxID=1177169 RepID=UPI001933A0F4|nr:hypothetical protein [Alloalcanivorax marinus]MBL7249466.1 hypothetical protein [Alloalcanivorax marinus]